MLKLRTIYFFCYVEWKFKKFLDQSLKIMKNMCTSNFPNGKEIETLSRFFITEYRNLYNKQTWKGQKSMSKFTTYFRTPNYNNFKSRNCLHLGYNGSGKLRNQWNWELHENYEIMKLRVKWKLSTTRYDLRVKSLKSLIEIRRAVWSQWSFLST